MSEERIYLLNKIKISLGESPFFVDKKSCVLLSITLKWGFISQIIIKTNDFFISNLLHFVTKLK